MIWSVGFKGGLMSLNWEPELETRSCSCWGKILQWKCDFCLLDSSNKWSSCWAASVFFIFGKQHDVTLPASGSTVFSLFVVLYVLNLIIQQVAKLSDKITWMFSFEIQKEPSTRKLIWAVHLRLYATLVFIWILCSWPHRGDSGVSEWASSDLSQFAIQARALSVHPQASQWLRRSFPATASGRGQRHRPGSHLLYRCVRKSAIHARTHTNTSSFAWVSYPYAFSFMRSSVLVLGCRWVGPYLWVYIRIKPPYAWRDFF